MTDEQKKRRNDYQKEYNKNMTDEQKKGRNDYLRDYKKYYAEKKLNKITQHDDNNDNDNDNDKHYKSL